MDFFRIAQVAEAFMEPADWRLSMIYGGVIFLIVFVFQAIALYTIASHAGIKYKWMAFVPFLSTYYIGVCARKNKAFGLDSKVVGIIMASLEFALCAGYIMHYVGYHFAEPFIETVESQDFYGLIFPESTIQNIDPKYAWAGFCYQTLGDILDWVSLIYLFGQVMLLSAFFQTYATRRYFIFTLCSVLFPIQGILFFAVRNNTGMSYREYVMREQERRYRMYRQYSQSNPYDQNNYNQNNYNQGYGERPNGYDDYSRPETGNEDPFDEFKDSDDPFGN